MHLKSDLLFILPWIAFELQCMSSSPLSSDSSKTTSVDKFIRNYIDEVERTLRPHSNRHFIEKRNTDTDIYQLQGEDLLVGFQEEFIIPVKFPNDIILFSHCGSETLYASALEANLSEPNSLLSNFLILFKFQKNQWVEKHRIVVQKGLRLAAEQIGDVIYIIMTEYQAIPRRGSPILYLLDRGTDTLKFVQMLDMHFTSHVIMWKWEDMEAFAAVAVAENESGGEKRYSTLSPVYHWEGGSHWNMVGALPTYNPRALTQFTISSSMFIAVANFQNDLGETTVDSEIFRFDLPSNKISLYQKLPTEAAVDIKYFCFQGSRTTERFLVYASAYHTDEEGRRDFTAASIVYKLSDEDYFVPFQALRVSHILSWQPVRFVQDNQEGLILLAAMVDGVASFQYDGWRFVSTGVTYDQTSFGPGPKIINVFYHEEETFISVANKDNPGFLPNVFKPVLKHDSSVENIQQEFATWEQQMSQRLATVGSMMASLLQIAQTAPSSKNQVVKLGTKATFMNAVIDNAETSTTKGMDDVNVKVSSHLLDLNSQLESMQQELNTLKLIIDQTTFPELIVFNDIVQSKADIQCVHACRTEQLQVTEINGENLSEFFANTLNIKELVEFSDDVTFESLALMDPLQASRINGHSTDSLIDWSESVYMEHGLQVEGDIALKNNLFVGGLLDGVAINLESTIENKDTGETVIVSPTNYFKSLNISHLTLSDGTLSGMDFNHFQQSSLKTHGDQVITEFQDFECVEVDEMVSSEGVFRAGINNAPPSPFHYSDCNGKPSEGNADFENNNIIRSKSPRSNNNIEAISFIDNEITITTDFTIFGTVTVQSGALVAKELVDRKHNITASRLMEHGILLDQPVIGNNFAFHAGFKAANLSVDSINGVKVSRLNLVDPDSEVPQVITARKEFKGGLTVKNIVEISGTVNRVNITEFMETLSESTEVHLDNITLHSVNSSNVEVGDSGWHIVWKTENETCHVDNLKVEKDVRVNSLNMQGTINDLYLENLLKDTVYNDGNAYKITGKKHFSNKLNISSLNLMKGISGFDDSILTPEYIWRKRLSQVKVVKVDRLVYSGFLDGIKANEFGEWMLTEGDQTIEGAQTIDSLSAVQANTSRINSVDIYTLISDAVYTFDNATLNLAKFENDVKIPVMEVGGTLQGLKVPEDLILSNTGVSQQVSAVKYFQGNVTIQGDILPAGQVSGLNITGLCQILSSNNSHIIINGSAVFKEEPNISISVNNKTWVDLLENIWFEDDDVVITNLTQIYTAEFNNLTVENINNNNVEKRLSKLVSLSRDETINGTFYFTRISMKQGLEAGDTTVGGQVQGLQVQSFVKDVLIDGEDQEITGILDFNHLIVDGILRTEGFVNSLDLSKDVMRNNVANNTVTARLTLSSMAVKKLTVPTGCRVARADVLQWNSTVVKKSGRSVITGNIVFLGQFDSPRGISVDGLVNEMKFDQNHIMMMNTPQQITGVKTFSPQSKLTIHSLKVGGFLNGINLTDFYSQQVKTSGNAIITGVKNLSSPLYSRRAILPEIFQGHNLSQLEDHLSFPLPWNQYETQLAALGDIQMQAKQSLAGQAYYLRNVSKVSNVEGVVFPLKNHNLTVLGAIRIVENKTTLSLLHWSEDYNMFHDKPGSTVYSLKTAPLEIQSVSLPGGDIAVYITRYLANNTAQLAKYGEMLLLGDGRIYQNNVIDGQPNSTLLSFQYFTNRTCFIVVADICRVYCPMGETRRIRLPSFTCHNVTQMSVLTTQQSLYLVGLQNSFLVVWTFQGKKFVVRQTKSQFNPVSAAATAGGFRGPIIAVANSHLVGSSRLETIDLYRLNEVSGELSLEQQLPSISPRQILFAILPSRESVLYVTSDNPATPLEVFIYRGIQGYIPLTVERTLAKPTVITTLTDHQQRHFVIITSNGKAQILQAQFQGGKSLI